MTANAVISVKIDKKVKDKASIIRMKLHPRKGYNLEVLAHELGHVLEVLY
mgnify:CR=1 FL=1